MEAKNGSKKKNVSKKHSMTRDVMHTSREVAKEGMQMIGDGLRIGVPIAIGVVTVLTGMWGFSKATGVDVFKVK